MRWDWAEANPPVSEYVGGLDFAFSKSLSALQSCLSLENQSTSVMPADATDLPLPDDAADMYFTDPPYYDVVPYADLSDLCYVWLNRYIGDLHPDIFNEELTPKSNQIVVNPYAVEDGRGDQSLQYYQERMTVAFSEGRRVLKPDGIGAIVFAHKGTAAWEKLLASILDAGYIVTASWPIDTERAARMRANKSAALGSSVHLIVRPRKKPDGTVQTDNIGDWRDVLAELPKRIHEWMPRLAEEGVVGTDAIFACLGPALEIYSRYSSVEKVSGDWAGDLSERAGSTVLDQLHQSMILFGAGRGEALKRFLVDDGIGMNPLYWRLAQALSALYPSGTDEKRWVDGVLARKKGLGL
jgi:adenine-specific DNA methylase